MMIKAIFTGVLLIAATAAPAQQLLVFPAVTDERPGVNGSLWVTTAMVIKTDPDDEVTVRRKWVCLADGGFVDDPATAPTWQLGAHAASGRLMLSLGGELLEGTGATAGAVALEVEGGEVIAHSNIMDIRWGRYRPFYPEVFGQGQHVPALRTPLLGPSHIPWLGGCRGNRCVENNIWQFLRNNIGIVNPNPEALIITGAVLPFGYAAGDGQVPGIGEWNGSPVVETFSITVPAFGWKQFNWKSTVDYVGQFTSFSPHTGFVISLTPDREDLPYYAYASVVFSPDPDTGVPEFSDPMFIPAEPGYIIPIIEARNNP